MTFIPSDYKISESALQWLETILSERFGHTWHLLQKSAGLFLILEGAERTIVFDNLQGCFTESRSDLPFTKWDAEGEGWQSVLGGALPVPGVSELPESLIEQNDAGAVIHYDILGLTYWMLTRQEEVARTDLDVHGRFPGSASHAHNHNYLERPIVDEWLFILAQVIQRTWPQLKIRQHQFSMKVSHDVDRPSRYGFDSPQRLLLHMAVDMIRHRKFVGDLQGPWIRMNTKNSLYDTDPYNTFDWIMQLSERLGLTSAFYFICGGNSRRYDADYHPEHPAIRALMRQIHRRGHEIGLHPSYNTYKNPQAIVAEAQRLKKVCAEEGIVQEQWGGRMHYLRWEQPTTLNAWDLAGMSYDTTLAYADCAGFRCGTCYEYPAFDPINKQAMKLRVRPLVVMEGTIFGYMRLGYGDNAYNKFEMLKERCRLVNGCFTLLWHNSSLCSNRERTLYERVLFSS